MTHHPDCARRTSVVYTGAAFSADHHDSWTYNDRNELTGTTRRAGTTVGSGTETTGARRVYAYDNIGNRDTYTKGTGAQTTYESNQLNQYVNVETASSPVTGQNLLSGADGNVTESYVVGDFDGDGSVGFSDLAIFSSSYGYCEGDPEFDERANLEMHASAAHVFRN
ncbi:MAG: hypothetical protein AMXMBFR47_45820 [Planctomycetota bacterium]